MLFRVNVVYVIRVSDKYRDIFKNCITWLIHKNCKRTLWSLGGRCRRCHLGTLSNCCVSATLAEIGHPYSRWNLSVFRGRVWSAGVVVPAMAAGWHVLYNHDIYTMISSQSVGFSHRPWCNDSLLYVLCCAKEDNRLWSSIIRIMELHSFELWSFLNVTDLWIFIIYLWFSIIEF